MAQVLFDRLKSNLAQCINDGTIYFVKDSNGNFTQIALGDGSKSHVVGIGPKMDDTTKQELMAKLGLTISSNMGTIQLGKLANFNGVSSQKVVTYERTGLGTDTHEISTVGYVQQYMKTAKALVYAGLFNAQTKEITDYNNAIISPSEEGNVTFDYLLEGYEGETFLTPGMSFIVGTAGDLAGYTGISIYGGETKVEVGDMIIITNITKKESEQGGSMYNEASILVMQNTNLKISDGAITTAKIADAAVTTSKLSTDIQSLISNLSKTATYAGIATPTTNPGTPEGPVFYIATIAGSYSNFSNIEVLKGETVILQWNSGTWVKSSLKPMTDFNSVFDAGEKSLTQKLSELDENIASAATTDFNLLVVEGEYYDQNGNIRISSDYNRLQLIRITSNKVYVIGIANNPNISCRCYDKDMNLLGTSSFLYDLNHVNGYKEFPEGTRYLGAYYKRNLLTLPKGCGIISCGSSLISLVEGIRDNKEGIIKKWHDVGDLSYKKAITSGTWVMLDELLSIYKGQKISMRIGASNIRRVILGDIDNRIFDSIDTLYDGDISELFSFNAKSSIEGVEIFIICDNLAEQTTIEIKTNLALELFDQHEQIEKLRNAGENNTTRIEELEQVNEGLSMIQVLQSQNLFNKNDADIIYGAYLKQNGEVQESSSYNVSGYIFVEPLTTYYKADGNNSNPFRFTCYYNKDKNVISGGLSSLSDSFTTPKDCYYVRVTVYSDSVHWANAQVAKSFIPYVPYDVNLGLPSSTIADKHRIATLSDISNVLYGKKWAVVGDSFTAEFSGNPPSDWFIEEGRYAGKSKVYGYIIGNRNNMTLQWLGEGGKTMATPADGSFTKTFSLNEYKNIDADVDYITIYLGINDSHHAPNSTGDDGEDKSGEIPLGTIDDTTNTTFYGAWNVVIPYLLENHPFAHIGIIVSNGCDTSSYRDAEIAIAKKYGIPYIDLNGDERTPFMLRSQNNDIPFEIRKKRTQIQSIDYDGSITGSANQHPNKDAHEFQADFIETWMKSL